MMEIIGNLLLNIMMGFVNLLIMPWHIYQWLNLDTIKLKMNAVTLMGMSHQFFFVVFAFVLILVLFGLYSRTFLRSLVVNLEGFNSKIGRVASWFALIMVIQQVMIIVVGQVFRGNGLTFSPLGLTLVDEQLQWLSGQLKFYNAILIVFASAYTFIEGGHVRVDLIYSAVKKRTKQWIDLFGTLLMFMPSTILLWWFSWPIATNSMFKQRPINIFSEKTSWRGYKFESSGTAEFSWVWAFKLFVVIFAGLMFICAVAFLLRNILALLEKDKDIPTHFSTSESHNGMGKEAPTGHPT